MDGGRNLKQLRVNKMANMFFVRWLSKRPFCWQASIDGGKTWHNLKSDNDEDSSEAIYEAANRFGMATNKWDIAEDSN